MQITALNSIVSDTKYGERFDYYKVMVDRFFFFFFSSLGAQQLVTGLEPSKGLILIDTEISHYCS